MVDVFAYHVGCPDEERERQAVIAVALIPTLQARWRIWALKSTAPLIVPHFRVALAKHLPQKGDTSN